LSQIAALCGANDDQKAFLAAWSDTVVAGGAQVGGSRSAIFLGAGLDYVEHRITGPAGEISRLAQHFVSTCGVPDAPLKNLMGVQQQLGPQEMTLWAKLKYTRPGPAGVSHDPSADCGYCVHGSGGTLDVMAVEVLLPNNDDAWILLRHSMEDSTEEWATVMYGAGLLPTACMEHRVTFESVSKVSLLTSLFFFQMLGFTKPPNEIVKELLAARPAEYCVSAFLGPERITRLAIVFREPGNPSFGSTLASLLVPHRQYDDDTFQKIGQILGIQANVVEYAASAEGYDACMGFEL